MKAMYSCRVRCHGDVAGLFLCGGVSGPLEPLRWTSCSEPPAALLAETELSGVLHLPPETFGEVTTPPRHRCGGVAVVTFSQRLCRAFLLRFFRFRPASCRSPSIMAMTPPFTFGSCVANAWKCGRHAVAFWDCGV